jgi:hypothetical protein
MFVFIDYQVDSLVSQEYVSKGVSSIMTISPPKWLNIVLEINGILCHCMEKEATRRMLFVNDVKQGIHSPTVPIIVGSKQGCHVDDSGRTDGRSDNGRWGVRDLDAL